MTIFQGVTKENLARLIAKGFKTDTPKSICEEYRLRKNNVVLILYNSGKLLLQGKEDEVDKIAELLEKLKIGEMVGTKRFRKESGWIIGSDESLKGDTFGGIVVAAVKADNSLREQLVELGVNDSKKLRDREIVLMAEKIRQIAPCEVKSVLPEEYNKKKGQTELLNKLHQDCADYLKPGQHVVDKFPGARIGSVQEEKAEEKYVEVAAASVLARAAGLQQLNYLSAQAGFTLPKGSTHVKDALQRMKELGLEFRQFVKLDFKNVKEFLSE